MDPTLDLMRRHRSVRDFTDEALDRATVREAVAAARYASTSSNVQAYSLLWVRDAAERRELARLTGGQPQVERAGAFFVVAGDQRRHERLAARLGRPHVANLEAFLLCAIDAALFAQNLALAFEARGFGICYIGGLRNSLPAVDRLLEVPHGVLPFFGLCVGRPAADPGQRPRLDVDGILFEDRYPTDEEVDAHVAEYDGRMAEYYEARGKPGYDWSGGIARKFAEARRTDLADYYRSKGARLE